LILGCFRFVHRTLVYGDIIFVLCPVLHMEGNVHVFTFNYWYSWTCFWSPLVLALLELFAFWFLEKEKKKKKNLLIRVIWLTF
jgi:hypothetical protein